MARPRTLRRTEARAAAKLVRDRERLFLLEPGGTPERPIEVRSAALVEPKAAQFNCPRCLTPLRVEAHNAPSIEGTLLREDRMICPRCGRHQSIWFRLVDTEN
jgi:predicted RNA-binding Zn-ribbon protein involved in translation (DUF1610 family)